MLDVPEVVRRKARIAGADAWLAELPGLVARLESRWQITVGPAFGDATEAYVAEATTATGEPAVIKLLIPRSDLAANEITVLRMAGGEGCVRLLRQDVDSSALLMERLGRSLYQLDLPIRRRHEILCAAAARVWRPASDCGLPTGADKARWLAAYITSMWQTLDRPCSASTVDHALRCDVRPAGQRPTTRVAPN